MQTKNTEFYKDWIIYSLVYYNTIGPRYNSEKTPMYDTQAETVGKCCWHAGFIHTFKKCGCNANDENDRPIEEIKF